MKLSMLLAACAAGVAFVASSVRAAEAAPHIVFIFADDLGFNDVSYHGGWGTRTPTLDGLAAQGARLERSYVNPVCSPTRSSMLSGRSVIHTGVQTPFAEGHDVTGLNLSYPLLPELLKAQANYSTYAVGKWHLGMKTRKYLPSSRGFQRYIGYYEGIQDYWNYYDDLPFGVKGESLRKGGTDFGMQPGDDEVLLDHKGEYSTQYFGRVASTWIEEHAEFRADNPMFMYLAFQGIHSANNRYVQAPESYIDRFAYVSPTDQCGQYSENCTHEAMRRTVVAAVNVVDDAVSDVVESLKRSNMWNNTILIFSTDNGGPTDDYNYNMANNEPLRGCKATYFEGGVRGVNFIVGPGIKQGINEELFHVSDWAPTLTAAVAETTGAADPMKNLNPPLEEGDGVANWAMLTGRGPSARSEIVHVTQAGGPDAGSHAIHSGHMKLMYDPTSMGGKLGWYPEPGRPAGYDNFYVKCGTPPSKAFDCTYASPCLFNITADPCEQVNVAAAQPETVTALLGRLDYYRQTAVYPWEDYRRKEADPRANPSNFPDTAWTPWLTDEEDKKYYPTNYTVPPPGK